MPLTGLIVDNALWREVFEAARERINFGLGCVGQTTYVVFMSLYTPPMFSFMCLRTAGKRRPSAPQIPSQSTCSAQGEWGLRVADSVAHLAQPTEVEEG